MKFLRGRQAGLTARPTIFDAPQGAMPMPMPAPKDDRSPDKKPDTAGHRERLRQRFLDAGPGALADYEMLELLLLQCLYWPNRPVSTNENNNL